MEDLRTTLASVLWHRYSLDILATRWINSLSGGFVFLDTILVVVAIWGVPAIVLVVAVLWVPSMSLRPSPRRLHVRHVVVASGLSAALGLLFNQAVLLFVHRARPYDSGITHLLIDRSTDFAFPSDHATVAFAVAATFLLHGRRSIGLLFMAAAVLVGLSRVYVGTHFVSDVLGGAVTAGLAAAVMRSVYPEGTRADLLVTRIL